MSTRSRFVALSAAALLGGCATITTSPSQDVTVLTVPAGAACDLLRDGTLPVGTIDPTPGTLRIGKSSRPTVVRCRLAGHAPAESAFLPSFQPMVLGNVLVGGLVGLVVDASTGAAARYPEAITVILQPLPPDALLPEGSPYAAPVS